MEQIEKFEKLLDPDNLRDGTFDRFEIDKHSFGLNGVVLIDCRKDCGAGLEQIQSFYLENLLFGFSGFLETLDRKDNDKIANISYHMINLVLRPYDEDRIQYILDNVYINNTMLPGNTPGQFD